MPTLSTSNKEFLESTKTFINEELEKKKHELQQKKEEYKRKNWRINEKRGQLKDILDRIDLLEKFLADMNQVATVANKHGNSVLILANVVYNEAGIYDDAQKAIAYAYLNRTGGRIRQPQGAEISHYKQLYARWLGFKDDSKYTFLKNFRLCVSAAQSRLEDKKNKDDPTDGAKHWLSPIGLNRSSGYPRLWRKVKEFLLYYDYKNDKYSKESKEKFTSTLRENKKIEFPNFARGNEWVNKSQLDIKRTDYLNAKKWFYIEDYKEFAIAGVNPEHFLFYKGVR